MFQMDGRGSTESVEDMDPTTVHSDLHLEHPFIQKYKDCVSLAKNGAILWAVK